MFFFSHVGSFFNIFFGEADFPHCGFGDRFSTFGPVFPCIFDFPPFFLKRQLRHHNFIFASKVWFSQMPSTNPSAE